MDAKISLMSVASATPQSDSGVKTKTQVVAERQVLVSLLAAVLGAGADEALAPTAVPFSTGICRHFALLFAAGTEPPPPPPAMSRFIPDPAAQATAAAAHQSGVQQPVLLAQTPSVAGAGAGVSGFTQMHRGLRELDCALFLDAMMDVLSDKVRVGNGCVHVACHHPSDKMHVWWGQGSLTHVFNQRVLSHHVKVFLHVLRPSCRPPPRCQLLWRGSRSL